MAVFINSLLGLMSLSDIHKTCTSNRIRLTAGDTNDHMTVHASRSLSDTILLDVSETRSQPGRLISYQYKDVFPAELRDVTYSYCLRII